MKQLGLILLSLLISIHPAVLASQPSGDALGTQLRIQGLLLKMSGVAFVATASCDADSGALLGIDDKSSGPMLDCIAVGLRSFEDLQRVESLFANPTELEGVLIHFTLKDPLPNKGGITVHN